MKKVLLVLSVLGVFLPIRTFAADTLKIGVLNFPPFYEVKADKEPTGMMLDYLKMAMDKAGYSYTVEGFPPKRLYQNLAEGKSDVFLGVKGVPDYEGQVFYSKSKITSIDMRIYARPETPLLKSKEELKGQRIMTIQGYSYGGFVKFLEDPANQIQLDPTPDHEFAFKKLAGKRADYVLDYRRPSEKTLKTVDIPGIQSHSISLIDLVIIVSKQTPNAQEIVDNLEKAFETLKNEGKLTDL